MTDIVSSIRLTGNVRPIRFIRFNPNRYKINDIIQRKLKRERYDELLKVLTDEEIPSQPLSVIYMYYDVNDSVPVIVADPEYDAKFRECITSVIY